MFHVERCFFYLFYMGVFDLNGVLRCVSVGSFGGVSYCGVVIPVGSRDEEGVGEFGVVHFLEHMLFKGTLKRSCRELLDYIEGVGGEINAYTTKEDTFVYVSVPVVYTDRAVDVLLDIVQSVVFDEEDLELEKGVVVDEILSYEDSPSEQIMDDYEELCFEGNSLAGNILGSEESVKGFTVQGVEKFYKENYSIKKAVFSYVGPLTERELVGLLDESLSEPREVSGQNGRVVPVFSAFNKVLDKDTSQAHCVIGSESYGQNDAMRVPMMFLNNVLGGVSFNSILSYLLREENGLTYNIETNYTSFSDTGLFNVYFGTDASNLEKCFNLIKGEFKKIREGSLRGEMLEAWKRQIKGQLTLYYDSGLNIMLYNAKSVLVHGKCKTLKELSKEIDLVTEKDVLTVAEKCLDFDKMSTLVYK